MADEQPHVRVEPGIRFGYPHIRGVPTDAIAGMVWAGEDLAAVADEFNLTRGEVLVACWFEGTHGRPNSGFRKAWRDWAFAAGKSMWRSAVNFDGIAGPPTKEGVRVRG